MSKSVAEALADYNAAAAERSEFTRACGFTPWTWEHAPWHPWNENPNAPGTADHAEWERIAAHGRSLQAACDAANAELQAANKREGL